jgi:hypothetical protein
MIHAEENREISSVATSKLLNSLTLAEILPWEMMEEVISCPFASN